MMPDTWPHAVRLFLSHPAPQFLIGLVTSLVSYRCSVPQPLTPTEVLLIPVTVASWITHEYLVHRYILHMWGNRYHDIHHKLPYYHVSIDGPEIVIPSSVSVIAVCASTMRIHLAATVAATYLASGLFYIWVHYLCHTKVRPGSILRHFKNHHILHHLRDDTTKHSVSFPLVDRALGT